MRYVRLVVLLALCSDVTAYAVTLRLRAEDHGIWGAELRACKGRVSRGHCALITPLVMADSGIGIDDLRRLPIGKNIIVNDSYLNPSFRVGRETAATARAIFSPTPQTENGTEQRQREEINSLKEEKAALQSKLESRDRELQETRKSMAALKASLTEAEKRSSDQTQQAVPQPKEEAQWKNWAKYAAGFTVGIFLSLLFSVWWFKVFQRNNRILPEYPIVNDDGTARGFKLREDYTYDCVSCEKDPRERGQRIKFDNLEKHIAEVEHSDGKVMPPIERIRTARRA